MSRPSLTLLPSTGNVPLYWCGPYAIALLARCSYATAVRAANRAEQERLDRIALEQGYPRGTWKRDRGHGGLPLESMRLALKEAFGIHINWTMVDQPPRYSGSGPFVFTPRITVRDTIEKICKESGKVYLVCSSSHYFTVQDGIVYHACDYTPTHYRLASETMGPVLAWAEVVYPTTPAS